MIPAAIIIPPKNGNVLKNLNINFSSIYINLLSLVEDTTIAAVNIAKLGNNGST